MLVRPNSLIALGNNSSKPDYEYRDNVQIAVYELIEGQVATTKVINRDEEVELEIEAIKTEQIITISFKGNEKTFSIILKGMKSVEKIEGGSFTLEADGIHIVPQLEAKKVTCYLE